MLYESVIKLNKPYQILKIQIMLCVQRNSTAFYYRNENADSFSIKCNKKSAPYFCEAS